MGQGECFVRIYSVLIFLCAVGVGCAKGYTGSADLNANMGDCSVRRQYSVVTGNTGSADVFMIDPISASGNPNLSPTSAHLDDYKTAVTLSHLSGQGILKGNYIEVKNGLKCSSVNVFNAFDSQNHFSYSHSDPRFQEAMAYYFGDIYQTHIDQIGFLGTHNSVQILAHCEKEDNSYFVRGIDQSGNEIEEVCLGDSISTPGASYSDDAIVTLHELQHETTVDNYSPNKELNQFWYDEAGSLNEAVSDFLSLMFTDSLSPNVNQLDPKIFSRWALGTFDPKVSHLRGAHRCPEYDPTFPNCTNFPSFNAGSNTISYTYPDGMGWPYANNYKSSRPVYDAFLSYPSQEEIHNAGVLVLGALWDVYSSVKKNYPNNATQVNQMIAKAVIEAIRNLPQANLSDDHSPVTFIGFASNLVAAANKIPEFTASDRSALQKALKDRGLYDMPTLDPNWLAVGPGDSLDQSGTQTPGVYVLDDPEVLQRWLLRVYAGPDGQVPQIPQGIDTGLNGKLDPGEVAVIWFDLENSSSVTAGGVTLTVTSQDPDILILPAAVNIGYLSQAGTGERKVQVMYGKVNGTSIVQSLKGSSGANALPTSNTYFKTDPFFNQRFHTGIWVVVRPETPHGKTVDFLVEAKAANSNGVTASQIFPVTIH